MTASLETLEFDLTREQVRVQINRMRRARSYRLGVGFRLLVGVAMLIASVRSLQSSENWTAAFLLLGGAYMLVSDQLFYWWIIRGLPPVVRLTLEYDDRSLLLRTVGRKIGNRYWWSRLTNFEEDDTGMNLYFDGSRNAGMWIPSYAFADENQRTAFMATISEHLRK